ncbi:MAG: DUF4157 domain-containing protein [Bacteroidota bacterium]
MKAVETTHKANTITQVKVEASQEQASLAQDTAATMPLFDFGIRLAPITPNGNGIVQPKLRINNPNDRFEQEADRIADQVLAFKPEVASSAAHPTDAIRQRPLAAQISRVPLRAQRQCHKCQEEEEDKVLQTKRFTTKGPKQSQNLGARVQRSRGSGRTMDSTTASYMGSRFGTDFSQVRIHTNGSAVQMNRDINAKAFTVGQDIFFNQGQYRPDTESGKHLLAHELTHTLQQQGVSGDMVQRRVDRVELSCAANQITFVHDGGATTYELTNCNAEVGTYDAVVTEGPNSIDFTLEDYGGGDFDFGYEVGPGQENPNTFFDNQGRVTFYIMDDQMQSLGNITSLAEFKEMVKDAGIARLHANRAALLAWREFLEDQLSPGQLRRQLHAEQELDLMETAIADGEIALYERRARTRNPAMRYVQQQQIEGRYRACTGCHATVQAESWGRQQTQVGPAWRTVVEQMEAHVGDESLDPTPRPEFLQGGGSRAVSEEGREQIDRYPSTTRIANAIDTIGPYLQQLGPAGYEILSSSLLSRLESSTSSESIQALVSAQIERRRNDYLLFISEIEQPDFDYMMLRPVVRELLPLVSPEVQEMVEDDIAAAQAWDIVEGIVVGVATIGALLLAIFPPTSAIGIAGAAALEIGLGAYAINAGVQSFEQGRILSYGRGADNVLDPDQQDAATTMMVMGVFEVVMGAIGIRQGQQMLIRLTRARSAAQGAGLLRHAEAQVGENTIRISDIDTPNPTVRVTNAEGRVLQEGPLEEFMGTPRAANDNAYFPDPESNVVALPQPQPRELPIAVGETRPLPGSRMADTPSGPVASSRSGGDPPDLFEIYTGSRLEPVPPRTSSGTRTQGPTRIDDGPAGTIDDLWVGRQRQTGVSLAQDHHIASRYNQQLIDIFDEVGLSIEGRANRVLLDEHGQLRGFWQIVDDGGRVRYSYKGHHPEYHQWVFRNLQRARGTNLPMAESQRRVLSALEQMRDIVIREPYILEYGTAMFRNHPELIAITF